MAVPQPTITDSAPPRQGSEFLFGETQPPRRDGLFAGVALETAIDRVLDYHVPEPLRAQVQVGQVVRVPLGRKNRARRGYVVSLSTTSEHPSPKDIFQVEDQRVLVPPSLMSLARWMSRYYVTPLGTVLESVIPSAVKKRKGLNYSTIVRLGKSGEEIQGLLEQTKAPKRRAVLGRLLLLKAGEGIDLFRLAGEAGVRPPTVRKLLGMGIITIRHEPDFRELGVAAESTVDIEPEIQLNEDQAKVVGDLLPRLGGGFSVNLLLGVTGSGKTEVYLQCIRRVVEAGKQAIVLVPEISLTPQTVRRFMKRFGRVAVLHSGLSATQRHRYWQQIATGGADVVVGARSAIFAPAPNLGMIVVDEEHEASYKQDTAPRYHGRDVAIKRAQLAGVPILLGSATPSLESYWRVTRGGGGDPHPNPLPAYRERGKEEGGAGYHLLSLPKRVRGLAMPAVELIDMRQEVRTRKGVHLLGRRLEHLLRTTVEAGHQAIILLNRRGYSNFVYCPSCDEVTKCKYCDATMTYHRAAGSQVRTARFEESVHAGLLQCHYCLAANPLPEKCPACGKKLSLFGLGTQRVEEELTKKFPGMSFARVDSDSMRSGRDYEELLGKFARKEISVLLGTQMIAKGLDYPNVTLVGVVSADTALALPDFRAAERTFQLITQVAGRAGRGDSAGRVVVQSFLADDPAITSALRHDYVGFASGELTHRRELGYPPFSRLTRIIIRDQEEERLQRRCEELAGHLATAINGDPAIEMKGPMPCAITRIAGYHRAQILLKSVTSKPVQRVLAAVRQKGGLAKSAYIAVDVDPVGLL